jgi:replication fork clamp-binding protein CrfC
MTATFRLALAILLLVLGAGTSEAQKDVGTLKAEAEKANGGQQAKLYAALADKLVDVADQQFTQGNSAQGEATVQEVLQYSSKAHDVALSRRDNRKEVEILLRETQRRLENLKRTLAAEDRPPLDAVEKKLADLRQDLLDAMFAPKKEDKK